MTRFDPRVDAYIDNSAGFARPILQYLRDVVHEACPQAEEAIKWGMPAFMYAGRILCSMAAFKQHVSFGYWRHAQVLGADVPRDGMGSYGHLATLRDLPPKRSLKAHIAKAMQVAEAEAGGARRPKPAPKPPPQVPADLAAALAGDKIAKANFDAFPPSARRDYVEWIVEAKREDTRARRLAQAVEWIAGGKRRNWKYEKC